MKILFVCTGNTCRSPMAEGIYNHLSKCNTASSAGISAEIGDNASKNSIDVLRNLWQIDISNHSSKLVSYELLKEFDLILTMTKNHSTYLTSLYPDLVSKIFTLTEYVYGKNTILDIYDPYGMSYSAYQKTAEELYSLMTLLINKV